MSEQKPLGREAILASKASRQSQIIEVAGLGSVRIMTPDTRGALFIHQYADTAEKIGATFVALVVNEDGNPEFPLTEDSIKEVLQLPGDVVLAVVNAGGKLNTGAIEEEIKNSTASLNSDSPTD